MKNIKIKMARLEKNMTQQELADKIGITRQTIGLIETGNYNPTIKLCLKICYALNKSLDELFWEDKNNEE
ncbi:helix-turn-helix transcriptional regulator [Facklamia sp. 7083-14-GEN3]|uniref:helix-turn-helix transcriptional regulator n=1 Tax=Facklamia sp. 7083-14-GEN3 TaxID=2973478 RepID=UPI0037C0B86F